MGAFLILAAPFIVTVQYGLRYFKDGLGEAVRTTGDVGLPRFQLTSETSFYQVLSVGVWLNSG